MANRGSFFIRALLALALSVGFYVLAVGMALGILALVYADLTNGGRIHIKLVLAGPIFAGVILWAVMPRIDRFQAPGPELVPEAHPQLFALITAIAERAGEPVPDQVFAVAEVNAFVSERGGFAGFGRRRIMGIGLPLMQMCTKAELAGIIGHEFGHFCGGDTRLSPFIYRTRMAMGRTIEAMDDSWIHVVFNAYGKLYLRVTHAISRRQEFAADAFAAGLVGPEPLLSAFRKLPGASAGYEGYMESEYLPALNVGYRPPYLAGLSQFMGHTEVNKQLSEVNQLALGESAGDPYDSHPPLPERIDALQSFEAMPNESVISDPSTAALDLLGERPQLERQLLATMFTPGAIDDLPEVDWHEAPGRFYVPIWRQQAARIAPLLQGRVLADVPDIDEQLLRELGLAEREVEDSSEFEDEHWQQVRSFGIRAIGASLAVFLHEQGYTLTATPGDPFVAHLDEEHVDVFGRVAALFDREHDRVEAAESWRAWLAAKAWSDLSVAAPG